ncbi:MAG: site-specific DNA-methyltransferase [Gammaproteobacteria bacterium]
MPKKKATKPAGPAKGDFIAPPEADEQDEHADALPKQEEFWRPPVRFGNVPVEKEPLGWDRRRGFRKLFPPVSLPFQVIDRVSFKHAELEPNRLFWGDNLHVMRQLPSESIDLIYIDPPFFSGRNYNVIFGDQNELRSFSDIWEGGMPGYLVWLNARLYEMKRLLAKTGSIYVHCDWHASHYIKAEMDKIFGHANFRNEIVWNYENRLSRRGELFPKLHDSIFAYTKTETFTKNHVGIPDWEPKGGHANDIKRGYSLRKRELVIYDAAKERTILASVPKSKYDKYRIRQMSGRAPSVSDVWKIPYINPVASERVGYPTQKPEALLERIIWASSNEGDIVADFFIGGGTTVATAQRLGRRWIASDQSRVAVALTADRLTRQVEEQSGKVFAVPDFTVEHWGIYEAARLADAPPEQFRGFVLECFGAKPDTREKGIHGYKGPMPVWVGAPQLGSAVGAADVRAFANAMRKTLRYKQDNLRDGTMLAWAFAQDAADAAAQLQRLEKTDVNFVRLDMVRIESMGFREHIASLSTEHADYATFLTFVQPPLVEVGCKRIAARAYKFDVSDSEVCNSGASIINVQWDFDYDGRFSSTPSYSFARANKQLQLQVSYTFPAVGKTRIACKLQDDMGGEGLWTDEIEVR